MQGKEWSLKLEFSEQWEAQTKAYATWDKGQDSYIHVWILFTKHQIKKKLKPSEEPHNINYYKPKTTCKLYIHAGHQ